MEKILFINACVRPESRTHYLASKILSQMDGVLEEVNLEKAEIKPLNWASLQERDRLVKNKDFSNPIFKYAKQFMEADKIVIAAPYWDLSFPSVMRIYFESVTINGISFGYTPEGIPTGYCKAKDLIYVTTAGGTIANLNLGYDYVKALAQIFYGIPKTFCVKAENLDLVGADVEEIMAQAIEDIQINKW